MIRVHKERRLSCKSVATFTSEVLGGAERLSIFVAGPHRIGVNAGLLLGVSTLRGTGRALHVSIFRQQLFQKRTLGGRIAALVTAQKRVLIPL